MRYSRHIADELCYRDALVMQGQDKLRTEHIIKGIKFPGALIKSVWPSEFWCEEKGQLLLYPSVGDYYTLPDACLISKGYNSLFSCGKCVSSDHLSAAAIRVGGIAIASGERAGTLAANIQALT